jgi:hypothetical protein
MKEETWNEILFTAFIIVIVFLALIYFTVPERTDFIEFQKGWWKELWLVITS